MSDAADRYRRLSERFAALVEAVPADRWFSASPCEGWTALDVVRHVVETHGMFEDLAGRPIELPEVESDPLAAFRQVSSVVQADLDDPERAEVAWDGHFGRTTFAEGIDRFVSFDLVVHGWDLARATGGDESIPDEELDVLEAAVEGYGEAARMPGVFGPIVDVPPGADRRTRVLALVGRSA
jgi:uncharacterized protein (TIGR03086 family)